MTQWVEDSISTYLSDFSRFERQAGDDGHSWLGRLRRAAIARFEQAGWPAKQDEEWRWTNLSSVTDTAFPLADAAVEAAAAEIAARISFEKDAACEIVFVNGHFAPQLSHLDGPEAGVRVMTLAAALKSDAEVVKDHLGGHVAIENNPFAALNTAFLRDGVLVHLGRSAALHGPIHAVFITTGGKSAAVSHPRILLIAQENSQAPLVETYAGDGNDYFTNAVTEIALRDGARIDHCKLQQEGPAAKHVATLAVHLGRNCNFVSHSAAIGGRLTRNGLTVRLDGEGADATLNGLVMIGDSQHVDNHTLIEHAKPNCASHELYKHVLDGRASGVFKGKILVRPGAQKTDSKQTSKTLLLSDEATMNSQPALQIYADDVKCTHGSTTGPVDEEMVFYLRSRGVGLDAARHLLTYAFAADITRRIKVEPVRARLEDFIAAQHDLPKDLRITDLSSHDETPL